MAQTQTLIIEKRCFLRGLDLVALGIAGMLTVLAVLVDALIERPRVPRRGN